MLKNITVKARKNKKKRGRKRKDWNIKR